MVGQQQVAASRRLRATFTIQPPFSGIQTSCLTAVNLNHFTTPSFPPRCPLALTSGIVWPFNYSSNIQSQKFAFPPLPCGHVAELWVALSLRDTLEGSQSRVGLLQRVAFLLGLVLDWERTDWADWTDWTGF